MKIVEENLAAQEEYVLYFLQFVQFTDLVVDCLPLYSKKLATL
jgi:hypothetical protein